MKISKNLPQFQEKRTLIVVTGGREGAFYLAFEGLITKLQSFALPNPKYSDKEGFFKTRARGNVIRTGSVLEFPKEKLIIDFLREFKKRLDDVLKKEDFENIYLFSPNHLLKRVEGELPAVLKGKLDKAFGGDYSHSHLFEFLEKIKDYLESKKVVPTSPEAQKILKKTHGKR